MSLVSLFKFEKSFDIPEARHKGLLYLLFASAFLIITVNAWVCDDAYITFRTIDNFLNGYGLRWNIAERVQSYTHPLWLFILSAGSLLTGEYFYAAVFISIVITMAALYVFAFKVAPTPFAAIIGLSLLIFSKAFVDYSTSGLENPATFLLLAVFLYFYLMGDFSKKNIFVLAFIAALGLMNRMDTALLFFPPLAYALYRNRSKEGIYYAALGFTPFAAWEVFSVIYYGFFFPNTAYAKLNTGLSGGMLFMQGLHYLKRALLDDTVVPVVIAFSLVLPLFKKMDKLLMVGIGIALYVLYVVKVGGDFMAGRFLAAPYFAAVVVLSVCFFRRENKLTVYGFFVSLLFVSVFIHSNAYGVNLYQSQWEAIDKHGIADERRFYVLDFGLMLYDNNGEIIKNTKFTLAKLAEDNKTKTMLSSSIGHFGFFSERDVHLIDKLALADPLLARLPANRSYVFRVGHLARKIPLNYPQSVVLGRNIILDPGIKLYYDKLLVATRAPIFAGDRFVEIWKLNTGAYDSLIDREYYIYEPEIDEFKGHTVFLNYDKLFIKPNKENRNGKEEGNKRSGK